MSCAQAVAASAEASEEGGELRDGVIHCLSIRSLLI